MREVAEVPTPLLDEMINFLPGKKDVRARACMGWGVRVNSSIYVEMHM